MGHGRNRSFVRPSLFIHAHSVDIPPLVRCPPHPHLHFNHPPPRSSHPFSVPPPPLPSPPYHRQFTHPPPPLSMPYHGGAMQKVVGPPIYSSPPPVPPSSPSSSGYGSPPSSVYGNPPSGYGSPPSGYGSRRSWTSSTSSSSTLSPLSPHPPQSTLSSPCPLSPPSTPNSSSSSPYLSPTPSNPHHPRVVMKSTTHVVEKKRMVDESIDNERSITPSQASSVPANDSIDDLENDVIVEEEPQIDRQPSRVRSTLFYLRPFALRDEIISYEPSDSHVDKYWRYLNRLESVFQKLFNRQPTEKEVVDNLVVDYSLLS